MKPQFALSLSFEGISLLARADDGWRLVGDVAIDTADLKSELTQLRKRAADVSRADLLTKVVIPPEQIRYMDIPATGAADVQDAIRAALDGATPYDVDDLVCDWSVSDGRIYLAAVARETLDEAEAFANEHGFRPVSLVAADQDGGFEREVNFGETAAAASILGHGVSVDPDTAATVSIGDAQPIPPEPEPEPELEIQIDEPEVVEPVASEAPAETVEAETAVEVIDDAPEDEPTDEEQDDGPELDDVNQEETAPAEDHAAVDVIESDKPLPVFGSRRTTPELSTAPPEPAAAFSSIRASRDNDAGAAPRLDGVGLDEDRNGATAPVIPVPSFSPKPEAPAPRLTVTPQPDRKPDLDRAAKSPQPEPETPAATPPKTPRNFRFTRKGQDTPKTASAAASPEELAQRERQRMTVFGMREEQKIGGKPRFLGLILTAALLLFLAAVAAWAAVFTEDGLTSLWKRPDATQVVDLPETPETLPTVEKPGDQIQLASVDPQIIDDAVVPPALTQPLPPEIEELSTEEAQARYAATGIWQMAPEVPHLPAHIALEDIYVASIDGRVESHDAVALPDLALIGPDRVLDPQQLPPAPGVRFAVDSRGMFIPTPEGVVTPDGYTLVLGRPPIVPPPRPGETLVSRPDPAEETNTTASTDFVYDGLRPKPRPGTLIEDNQRTRLGGVSLDELAALRPKLRPVSVKEEAEAKLADQMAQAAQEAAEADVEPEEQLIAMLSPAPKPRPRNFASIVKRAEEAPQETQVAAVAPRTVSPSIPSSTTVAKQATVKNAIRLNQMNLIGVYGKPSARRALIRMSNGRYKKVKVGDQIDGGRVAAIGDDQLRYVKGGRSITLKMPKG